MHITLKPNLHSNQTPLLIPFVPKSRPILDHNYTNIIILNRQFQPYKYHIKPTAHVPMPAERVPDRPSRLPRAVFHAHQSLAASIACESCFTGPRAHLVTHSYVHPALPALPMRSRTYLPHILRCLPPRAFAPLYQVSSATATTCHCRNLWFLST